MVGTVVWTTESSDSVETSGFGAEVSDDSVDDGEQAVSANKAASKTVQMRRECVDMYVTVP